MSSLLILGLSGGLAALCAGISVALVVQALIRMNQSLLEESQAQFGNTIDQDLGPMKIFLPIGRIGAMFVRPLAFDATQNEHHQGKKSGPLAGLTRKINRIIKQAGQPGGLLGVELLGMMLMNFVVGVLLLVIFGLLLKASSTSQLILMGIAAMLTLLPLIWILDLRKRRQKSIRKGLPYAFDLLTLGVEAGLDFTVAIKRLSEKMGQTPLSQEFARLLHDLQMGLSRRDSLSAFRERIDMLDVNLFVSALVQADELGSPLGPILKVQSETLREKRFQRAEEQAMKAPVKIIFPLALFILPVTGMIFMVPLFIKLKDSLGGL